MRTKKTYKKQPKYKGPQRRDRKAYNKMIIMLKTFAQEALNYPTDEIDINGTLYTRHGAWNFWSKKIAEERFNFQKKWGLWN